MTDNDIPLFKRWAYGPDNKPIAGAIKIMHPAKHTIGVILKIVGVERERFKEWTMKGFIASSEQVTQGKRTLHLYSDLGCLLHRAF